MAMGIERPQTMTERSDYRSLGTVTPKDVFLKQLAEVEMEFTVKHRPFDLACARGDFMEELEQMERESERQLGFVDPSFVNKVKFPDLKKYGDMNRFEIKREDVEMEMVNINGLRSSVKTGVSVCFVCKQRGHKITVFMDNDVYKEWKAEGTKVEKKGE